MEKFGVGAGITAIGLWFVVVIAAIFGWVMNIIKLFGLGGAGWDGNEFEIVIRGVGIPFAPLGAIMGWL